MAQHSVSRPWAARPWASLGDIQRDLDALLGGTGTRPSMTNGWGGVFPPVNLYETTEAYVLTSELPGVDPSDIHVSLEGSTITISGDRKIHLENHEGASLHRRERQTGGFRRAFDLGAKVEADKVEAIHKNGVLMLRIPKSEEAKPRQITVQAS